MLKTILIPLLLLLSNSSENSVHRFKQNGPETQTGTLEKMSVATGNVAMDIDLNRLNGIRSRSQVNRLRFDVASSSFFSILVFNNVLRGPELGSMELIPQSSAILPAPLNASFNQLIIEKIPWGEPFDIVVRDGKTGFVFFNIEGNLYEYDSKAQLLSINEGRLLVSKEFAAKLGRPAEAGSVVGKISITASMRLIEITQVVNGQARSAVMPPVENVEAFVPGPDVIVGDLSGLAQFGSSSGTQVGLAVGTDSCNAGAEPLHWFSLQSGSNDHPVIPQNLYRMSGGAANDERFEQVGQSNVKHAFTALQMNLCAFGCQSSGTGTLLGVGCSDPYDAGLNSGPNLGSRAWVNPFNGSFPVSPSPNSHSGHSHLGPSHRILVEMADLNTTLNPGATYYAEAQYVTPHEYAWCQAHPGQCNMYNNASYRRYNVTGTTSPFSFQSVGSTVRLNPAIRAWAGAIINQIEPEPGNDGIGFVGYKVTNPSPGVWHYEYAVYNQNLDRAIQSFSVPLGLGVTVSNAGFHAPPQHPGWANDGTVGNTGYSSTPWTPVQASDSLTWSSETFAQNQNANAIRWGTLYNYRFDSNRPPQTTNATVGFFKTGAPISVQIQGPTPTGPVPPTVQFSLSGYSLSEGGGSAVITVTRTGDTTSTSAVDFATSDGSALQSNDYIVSTGTLTFNPGDTSKTFGIPIVDDAFAESSETTNLTLSNATGATLGAQNTATLTINDNDSGGPSIPQRRFFAQLNGAQETPANGSSAIGSGIVLLNSGETSALVGLQFAGLSSAETGAHVHGAAAIGATAPIIFPLPTPTNPVVDFPIIPTTQQVSELKAGQHYLNVHSSNFTGGEIRGQLLWNPTLEDAFFVRQHYLDFLNREPDPGGLSFWLSQLHCPQGVTGDQANVACFHDRTIGVSNAFYFSGEFQKTASFVFLAYRAAYGNTQPFPNPDPFDPAEAGKLPEYDKFMSDRPRVLGGANLAQQQLAFTNLFVTRPEFASRYGAGLNTAALFVDAVLANILASDGVPFSVGDRTALIDNYNNAGGGNAGRAMVMWHLSNDYWNTCPTAPPCLPGGFGTAVDNRAFIDANYNRFFALVLYFGYLRRNPEIGGFLFWQNQINQAPVRNVPKQNSLVCSFITSGEYQNRFGPGVAFGAGQLWPRTNAECPP